MADGLQQAIAATRALTGRPFGVNLFAPSAPGDLDEVAAYGATLQPEADRLGVPLGEPHWDDDAYDAKLESRVQSTRVHLVSFTFGCPTVEIIDRLHRADIQIAVTVTSVTEAQLAADVGVDLLAVQGTQAGGTPGSFADLPPTTGRCCRYWRRSGDDRRTPDRNRRSQITGRDAAAVLRAGAIAVQVGTALLCSPEAGLSAIPTGAIGWALSRHHRRPA